MSPIYRFADCELAVEAFELRRGGRSVALEPRVFDLLVYLVERPNRLVSKQELLEAVWSGQFVNESALSRCIHEARRAVGDSEARALIKTVYGRGFRFTAPVEELEPGEGGQVETPEDVPEEAKLPRPSDAAAGERRQATFLACELMAPDGVDPEELRELLDTCRATCEETVMGYGCHIAQVLSDRLLVCFGYPEAHEDDAHRAVHAGLELLSAVSRLGAGLEAEGSPAMTVRQGVATGLVVTGRESFVGTAPREAAALQALAEPGALLIGAETYELVRGSFACEGVTRPEPDAAPAYRVRHEAAGRSRFEAATRRGLTPLVGRQVEVGLLLREWGLAKGEEGRVVVLRGEAGIGKSRLAAALLERVAEEPHTRLRCQSSPYHVHSAFYPLLGPLERAVGLERRDGAEEKLEKLDRYLVGTGRPVAAVAPLFADLLSIPCRERYGDLSLTPVRRREKTIEALVDSLLQLAESRPVILVFEDAHWADPSSLAALDLLVDRAQEGKVLVLVTCRPELAPRWDRHSHVTSHSLGRLSREEAASLARQAAPGKKLPEEVMREIVARSDGVPLFVEELTRSVLEAGLDATPAAGSAPNLQRIPTTIQDLLTARLDRLGPARRVAHIAATLGRQASWEALVAVAGLPDEELEAALDRLVARGLAFQRGQPPEALYTFRHALVRDAAYDSMLRSDRREIHRRIGEWLEREQVETARNELELTARHYTEADLPARAIPFWIRAGQRAVERSAYTEAIAHLRQALALLETLPPTPERVRQELELQVSLAEASSLTRGHGSREAKRAWDRARELCAEVGESPYLASVLWGLSILHLARGEYRTARGAGEELLRLGEREGAVSLLTLAHDVLGIVAMLVGEPMRARVHQEAGERLMEPTAPPRSGLPARGLVVRAGGASCVCQGARNLWVLGYSDRAREKMSEGLALARAQEHPYGLGYGLALRQILDQHLRNAPAVLENAGAQLSHAREQGFPLFAAEGEIYRGWAEAEQGRVAAGIELMRQGLAAWRALGAGLNVPYFLSLLAHACAAAGNAEEGLSLLAEACSVIDARREHIWEAEVHRLVGELMLRRGEEGGEAEASFRRALEVARRQSAKALELRAGTSLARLWQRQGKNAPARALLSPVYEWFSEGLDTLDLCEAKQLLDALG